MYVLLSKNLSSSVRYMTLSFTSNVDLEVFLKVHTTVKPRLLVTFHPGHNCGERRLNEFSIVMRRRTQEGVRECTCMCM